MARASRHVYPNDVRSNLGANRVPVVWAGLLRDAEFIAERSRPVVRMTIEHHYFDWIEDHGAQRAIYLLSPRGEGTFRCTWPLNPSTDLQALRRVTVAGSMVVIYGTPLRLDGDAVDLGEATYARLIPPHLASTQHLNYGRREPPGRRDAGALPLSSGMTDAAP